MLTTDQVDLGDLVEALRHQVDYETRWLLDPRSGKLEYWTRDCGIDGQNPVDLEELDLIPIDPLPSHVWYEDMADFAAAISDETASRRLERAIRGRGAFRRFKDELYEEYSELVEVWRAFSDARAKKRAVEWLVDSSLVADADAERRLAEIEEPELP